MKNILKWIRKNGTFRTVVAVLLCLSLLVYGTWYVRWIFGKKYDKQAKANYCKDIYPYNASIDKQFITDLFKENWYWLVASQRNFNYRYVNNILDNKASSYRPEDFGNLHIYTYRDNNQPIGFTAFYKKGAQEGVVLFLGVDKRYRRKGYASNLFSFALHKLKQMGATTITLYTRTNNKHALKIYTKFGFKEVWRDKDFVKFKMVV